MARKYETLDRKDLPSFKSLMEETPKLELKPLSPNLKYVFLNPPSSLLVIISSSLTNEMEEKLLRILNGKKKFLVKPFLTSRELAPPSALTRSSWKKGTNLLFNLRNALIRA